MKEKTKKAPVAWRIVIGDVLIALVFLMTLNLSIVMVHRVNTVVLKDIYRTNFYYELAIFGILLLFSLDVRFHIFTFLHSRFLRIVGLILRIAVTLVTCFIIFFVGKAIVGSLIRTPGTADHAIVLGMALENGQPTKDLLYRLDTAEAFLEENPDGDLILTGGNPDMLGRTEAGIMQELLLARGIKNEKMILEDQAHSTRQNFKNVSEIANPSDPMVLISSNYHMNRAVATAKEAGFTQILRRPAPSDSFSLCANLMWEVIMDLNNLTKSPKSGKSAAPH